MVPVGEIHGLQDAMPLGSGMLTFNGTGGFRLGDGVAGDGAATCTVSTTSDWNCNLIVVLGNLNVHL